MQLCTDGRRWPSLTLLPPSVESFISRSSEWNLFSKGIKSSCTQFGFHLQTKTETLSCHSCATSAVQIQCFTKEREERKLYPFPVASSLYGTRKCFPFLEQMKMLSE